MLEKKFPFLMNNLIRRSNKITNNRKSKIFIKDFKGILPQQQLQMLNEMSSEYNSDKSTEKTNYNVPHKEKNYVSKQCSVRENLITEVDINEMNKNQNNS